ncbi:hypothetical protein BC829DRAFT_85368 [Chytridium lagenaria]|nr:hypothetical protein BC829DRAFT_85368 [Chytridium lagenaria]
MPRQCPPLCDEGKLTSKKVRIKSKLHFLYFDKACLQPKLEPNKKRRCAHRLVSFPPELLWKILITLHPTDVHTVCRTLGINGFTNSFDFAVRNLKYHGLTAEVLSEITWNHLDITFVAALLTSIPINHGVLLLLCMDSGPNSPCERHGEMVKEAVDIVFERMGKDITKWKGMCHPLAVSFLVAIGAVEVLRALLDNMAMHRRCFREYLESAFDMALRKRFKEAAGLLVRYTGFIRSRHEKDAALAAFRYAVAFEGQEEVDKALGNLVIVPGLAVRAVEDAGFANDGEMERIVGSLRELVRRPEFQDGFRVNFGLVGKRRLLMEELFRWDQITNGDQALDVMDVETFKWMLSNKESLSWWVATSLRSTVDLMRKFGEKGRTDLVEVLLEDAEGPEIIKKAKVAFEVGLTKGNVELVKMVMERYEVVEDSRCLRTLFKFGVFPRYHMSEYNSSSEDEIDGKALHMEQLDLVGDLAARKSEILGILLESPYVDPSAYQNLAFRKAVYMQNAPLVKKLLDHPRLTLPRNCDKLLKNPLSAAVAKLLVGCGRFQLHKLCQLEFALRHGETGLLEALLEPNCFDEKFKQEMFLHAACRRGISRD